MEFWLEWRLVVLALTLCVASLVWHSRRSRSLLERWAAPNGYRVIDADYRDFFRGPFFWTSSKGQTVYRVTVEVGTGIIRRGWVRCGGRWLGLLSEHVEVRWDEAPAVEVRGVETANPMYDRCIDG